MIAMRTCRSIGLRGKGFRGWRNREWKDVDDIFVEEPKEVMELQLQLGMVVGYGIVGILYFR